MGTEAPMTAGGFYSMREKNSGFTLIELLLVLVLIGIGTSLAIVSVDQLANRSQERRWLDRMQQELRRMRNQAVLSGRPVQATVDFERGTISGRSDVRFELPVGYGLSSIHEASPADASESSGQLELLFFPDGTMLEAAFAMMTPGGVRQEFHMEPVSGRIERTDVAARP